MTCHVSSCYMYSCHVSFIHVISSALRSCHALLVTHALLLMPCYKTHVTPSHVLPSAAPLPCHVVFTHVMLPLGRSFHVMACYLYSCHVSFNHVILCNLLLWSLGGIISQSDQTGK